MSTGRSILRFRLSTSGWICLVGTISITLFILRALGRDWWCSCGGLFMWTADIWSPHTSQHLLDPYSFSHFLHGIVFFWLLKLSMRKVKLQTLFLISVLLECAWEVLENSPIVIERYRATTIALEYFGDSILNSLSDILAEVVGFIVAASFRFRVSLLVYLLVEVSLLIWVRDNLTLNVLMLIAPIDVIKEWQLGGAPPGV